jgi:demethylmenaquinone methyltransferase/2-methoxy-6-polyprenyl-1,4-benzoquinol methylase
VPGETLPSPIEIPRIARIYDQTAAFYDEVVAAQQAGPKLAALEVLARQRGERVLEVGAGTAWAFARLIEATGADGAVGVDAAPGMIDVASQRVPGASLLLGDALRLPFLAAIFDCLLSTYTLEVLPDAAMLPALREWHRVLRTGGRIVVCNLTDGEGAADAAMTEDWRRRFVDDPEAFGGARPLHAAPLLAAAGFVDVTRRYLGPEWPSEVLAARRP